MYEASAPTDEGILSIYLERRVWCPSGSPARILEYGSQIREAYVGPTNRIVESDAGLAVRGQRSWPNSRENTVFWAFRRWYCKVEEVIPTVSATSSALLSRGHSK